MMECCPLCGVHYINQDGTINNSLIKKAIIVYHKELVKYAEAHPAKAGPIPALDSLIINWKPCMCGCHRNPSSVLH